MKRNNIMFIVPFMLLSLVGCNNISSKVENFNVKDEVTGIEKDQILSGVKKKFENLESMEFTFTIGTYNSINTNEVDSTVKINAYKNNVVTVDTTAKTTLKNGGLNQVTEKNIKQVSFFENQTLYTYIEQDGTKKITNNKYATEKDYEEAINEFINNTTESYFSLSSMYNCYKVDGGYSFIKSSYSKNVSPYSYGNGTKELITIEKQYEKLDVDKSYKVKSFEVTSAKFSNKDQSTNEWYKEEKAYEVSTAKASFKYGQTKDYSIKELDKLRVDTVESSSITLTTNNNSTVTANKSEITNPTPSTAHVKEVYAINSLYNSYTLTPTVNVLTHSYSDSKDHNLESKTKFKPVNPDDFEFEADEIRFKVNSKETCYILFEYDVCYNETDKSFYLANCTVEKL